MSNRNAAEFWTTYPKTVGRTEYLKQVGHTVNSQPISERQIQLLISDIYGGLELEQDDILLDLCCGNGLITKELAKTCQEIVAVDFSQPLIEIASQDHCPANVSYHHMNVLELDKMPPNASRPFNKVLMYAALQHFSKQDLAPILENILRLSSDDGCVIMFGGIPDKKRMWKFYNTPKRKLDHLLRKISGRDAMGTWWDREFIERTCQQLDLQYKFHKQNEELYSSHYRFDVTIF